MFINDINVIDNFIITVIIVKIYIVNNLKINIFVNVDVLKFQKITLNFEHNIFIINNCEITTIINLINCVKFYIKRIIRNRKTFIVLFNKITKISIIFYNKLFNN